MAHQLPTETEIDATPATVWTVLTELATLPDRTLFRTSPEGEVVDGARRPESLRAGFRSRSTVGSVSASSSWCSAQAPSPSGTPPVAQDRA